jgi:hypothetical protein
MQQQLLLAALAAAGALLLALTERDDSQAGSRLHLVVDRYEGAHHSLVAARAPNLPNLVNSTSLANQFFISQYRSQFNPTADEANSDCGPACLAMAMKRFFADSDFVRVSDPGRLVKMARVAMTGSMDEYVNTDNDDVIHGAQMLGLNARRAPDLRSIDGALDSGAMLIVSGSPSVPGTFAHRLPYHHCRNGHFIGIAGRNGDRYLLCDPESTDGTFEITRGELAAFISFWPSERISLHGAVALWPSGTREPSNIADLENSAM